MPDRKPLVPRNITTTRIDTHQVEMDNHVENPRLLVHEREDLLLVVHAGHLADGEDATPYDDLVVAMEDKLAETRAVGEVRRTGLVDGRVGEGGVLGDEVDDVHAEARDAAVEPEAEDGVDGRTDGGRFPV